jgi:N6-L-threonylcarbamoyladenine synthase
LVKDYFNYELLGETKDDAAGEAFDKAAKLLGLPYPGGPYIDKLAKEGNPLAFHFAKSNMPNFDFSFSGIKTSLLYFLKEQEKQNPFYIKENVNDICASYQSHVVDTLLEKVKKSILHTGVKDIALAGGVSANSELRAKTKKLAEEMGCKCFIPPFEHCTDNGAMIAISAYQKFLRNDFSELSTVPKARWGINQNL